MAAEVFSVGLALSWGRAVNFEVLALSAIHSAAQAAGNGTMGQHEHELDDEKLATYLTEVTPASFAWGYCFVASIVLIY